MDRKGEKIMERYQVKKAFILNENYKFPSCPICQKELSPYSISSNELNKMNVLHIIAWAKHNLILINQIGSDKHLIWVCSDCFNLRKPNDNNNLQKEDNQ